MINVIAVYLDRSSSKVNVYTFFPFTQSYCERVEPVLWMSHFNNTITYMNGTEIFPNKLKNFYNCPIKVATCTVAPYMMLRKLKNDSYVTGGIEGIMFRVIAQRLNFRPIIIVNSSENHESIANFQMVNALRKSKPKVFHIDLQIFFSAQKQRSEFNIVRSNEHR